MPIPTKAIPTNIFPYIIWYNETTVQPTSITNPITTGITIKIINSFIIITMIFSITFRKAGPECFGSLIIIFSFDFSS